MNQSNSRVKKTESLVLLKEVLIISGFDDRAPVLDKTQIAKAVVNCITVTPTQPTHAVNFGLFSQRKSGFL